MAFWQQVYSLWRQDDRTKSVNGNLLVVSGSDMSDTSVAYWLHIVQLQ